MTAHSVHPPWAPARAGCLWLLPIAVLLAPPAARAEEAARPKVALALGGGAAKGIAHVGVLRWLEEHRIPVDYLAGTSMGGLVGGTYAVGMTPAEIEELLETADWDLIFKADAPYRQKSFRRKQDEADYPVDLELGLKGGLSVPSGLNPGHHIGVLLSSIALAHSTVGHFDDLPIPFRCLAVDMRSNESVVVEEGSLGTALRATMAIPAFFDPIVRDGRLLADGGVLNNVPVDVARGLGGEIVIAVKVDSPDPDPPETILGLGFHAIGMMMEELTQLRVRDADIVVVPDLTEFASTDYRRSAPLIALGYEAAETQADALLKLSIDEDAWQEHLAARRARIRQRPTEVGFYQVTNLEEGEARRFEALLDEQLGRELDEARLATVLGHIVGTGRYAAASYGLVERDGETGLEVAVREKPHAPPVINFATELSNEGEDIEFNLGARATFMDPTTEGSELRFEAKLGRTTGIGGELYQTLGNRGIFVSLSGAHLRTNENLYQDDELVALFRRKRWFARAGLGWTFAASQLSLGYEIGHLEITPRVGATAVTALSGAERVLRASLIGDTRDAAFFARRGLELETRFAWYLEAANTEESFGRLDASLSVPFRVGDWSRGLVRAEIDTLVGAEVSEIYQPALGGPFRLSAFGTDALRGRRAALGHIGYLHSVAKLPDPLGDRLYVVALLEAGSAFAELEEARLKFSATSGLAFDGFFGPVFFGASIGNGGQTRLFLTFGTLLN